MADYLIPCLLGLEKLVGDEVKKLGLRDVRVENGRILCRGTDADAARLNLHLRCGARVLLVLGEFPAVSFEELFQGTRAIAWEDYLPRDAAFPVKGYSISSQLHSVPACQSIIKKAMVERLKSRYRMEQFPETGTKYQVRFSIFKDRAAICLDTSGEGLYKRGYRAVGVEDYETKAGMSRLYNYVNFDKFKDLPVTGTNGEPYVEQIIDVAPQVIVMSAYASCDADELSAKTGIPVFVVPGSDTTLDDAAYETIRLLGELYGLETRAQELTKYLKGIQTDLDTRTAKIADDQKPSVYVGGVSFKGQHGFEGTEAGYGPFALIHAKNLADTTGQTGAFNIDTEQVLAWDPDMIFLDFNGMPLINEDYQANPAFYNSLTAVRSGKVYSQISFRSSASNLETALADAYYAACMLYPEQFADIDPEAKAGEIFTELLGSNPYPDLKEAGYAFRAITIGE